MNEKQRSKLADDLEAMVENDDPGDPGTLLAAAAALREPPETLIAEQRTLTGTVRVPDGWSWEDVYVNPVKSFGVGGWLSGVAMQKGEPILEQDGHVLLVRQGETSFEPRQATIYRKLSAMTLAQEETGEAIPSVSVLVVHGFQGDRRGFTVFRGGEQEATRLEPGAEPIRDWIVSWFREARENKIVRRVIKRPEKIDQMEMA